MLRVEWQIIDDAPRDGSWIIGLNRDKTHIGIYRWISAKEIAELEGGNADDFCGCWVYPEEPWDEPMVSPVFWVHYTDIIS